MTIRDSYFTGVSYGRIDIQRIAATLKIWESDKPADFRNTLVVDRKGLGAIEHYVIGRYQMHQQVYFHKNVRAAEMILGRAFKRAADCKSGRQSLSQLVDLDKQIQPEEMLRLDDAVCVSLLHKWAKSDDGILRDLSGRILDRRMLSAMRITLGEYVSMKKRHAFGSIGEELQRSIYPASYYFAVDQASKPPYTAYSANEHDAINSMKSHITIDVNGSLAEASKVSGIIRVLSEYDPRTITLVYPNDFSRMVKKIVRY